MANRQNAYGAPAQTIWLVSKYITPRKYGFETRPFALARRFREEGRTPIVITSDSNHFGTYPRFDSTYTREIIDGVETWWVRTRKYTKTASIARVISWIDFEIKLFRMPLEDLPKPDVILVSSLSLPTILNGLRMRRKYGGKLVFEIRDIWPLTAVEEGGFSPTNPFIKVLAWIERIGYRRSDMIVGTMPNLGEHVRNVAGRGLRCECVPFGFDPDFFSQNGEAPFDMEVRIPRGRLVVGYAGSMGTTNALETIIQCVKDLKDDDRFFFLFLGAGDLRDKFVAETIGLSNVAFLAKVDRSKVRAVLAQCDLLYFAVQDSPVWRYGMSLNKLIDYMMAGKPIVGSYSGYPSMLDEAGCGEFVPASDVNALKQALNRFAALSEERRASMGRAGRDWLLANRPWEVVARKYLELLDEVAGDSSPVARAMPPAASAAG